MSLVLRDWELSSDAYRARLLIGFLGLEVRTVGVDVVPGRETESPAFRALSPAGAMPVLEDGAVVLSEIGAILIRLAETRDRAATWLPRDPERRARCLDALFFALGPLRASDTAREAAIFHEAGPRAETCARARRALRVLEGRLARRALAGEGFLAGAAPTIADIAAFPAAALAVDWGEALEAFPKTRLWTRRLRALPGFRTTPGVPDHL